MTAISGLIALPEFKLKMVNADFVVDEIYLEPRLAAPEAAAYSYLYVEKQDLTTFRLLRELADHFQLEIADVGAAGLKDEEAITRQLISIRAVIGEEAISAANAAFRDKKLLIVIRRLIGYGQTPVEARKLHGNKFAITIRNLEEAVARQTADYLAANRFQAFVNYYDEQRFGVPDSIHNTHLIGQHLLAGEWPEAYEAYLESGNDPQETALVAGTRAAGRSHYEALTTIMPAKLDFFISAYHSFLWNRKLNEEIARLPGAIQAELPYLGLLAFPAAPTAPLPAGLSIPVEKRNWQTGQTYPTVKARPALINTPVYLLQAAADSRHPGRQALTLAFCLPTGCYATMLIKQLLLAAGLGLNGC